MRVNKVKTKFGYSYQYMEGDKSMVLNEAGFQVLKELAEQDGVELEIISDEVVFTSQYGHLETASRLRSVWEIR